MGNLLINLFLVYCDFAISVQGIMIGVARIYYVYILKIIVLAISPELNPQECKIQEGTNRPGSPMVQADSTI